MAILIQDQWPHRIRLVPFSRYQQLLAVHGLAYPIQSMWRHYLHTQKSHYLLQNYIFTIYTTDITYITYVNRATLDTVIFRFQRNFVILRRWNYNNNGIVSSIFCIIHILNTYHQFKFNNIKNEKFNTLFYHKIMMSFCQKTYLCKLIYHLIAFIITKLF